MEKSTQRNYQHIREPIQEIMELNIKTIQNVSYINPTDLLQPNNPDEMLEKNIKIFNKNRNNFLDYMSDFYDIMERYWMNFSSSMRDEAGKIRRQVQNKTPHAESMNKAAHHTEKK